MPFRLRPRDTRLGPDLGRLCGALVESVRVLTESVSEQAETEPDLRGRAGEADHRAEEAMHAVLRELASALVTPIDRADVFRLAASLRDCSRAILDVVELIDLFGGIEATDAIVEEIQYVQLAADVTAATAPRLVSARTFAETWIELGRLRKQSAERHRRSIAELTAVRPASTQSGLGAEGAGAEAPSDPMRTMRLLQIEKGLQAVMRSFDVVGHVLQIIVVKEG